MGQATVQLLSFPSLLQIRQGPVRDYKGKHIDTSTNLSLTIGSNVVLVAPCGLISIDTFFHSEQSTPSSDTKETG